MTDHDQTSRRVASAVDRLHGQAGVHADEATLTPWLTRWATAIGPDHDPSLDPAARQFVTEFGGRYAAVRQVLSDLRGDPATD